jgi:predicted nucleotidyltransferase
MIQGEEHKQEAQAFYQEALKQLNESGIPFLLAGAFALRAYTGIYRDTKDMDIFCKPIDYPKIVKLFTDQGYQAEITDARWLAKVFKDEHYMDIIFDTVNNICKVDDSWFEHATEGVVFNIPVRLIGPEELIWCKTYVQNRERFDGADVNHIFFKKGHELNWQHLYSRMEQHWHLLLERILNFQFVYPSERDTVPRWLFDELIARAQEQYDIPVPVEKVCRGPIIDQTQYQVDIKDWDLKVVTIKTV